MSSCKKLQTDISSLQIVIERDSVLVLNDGRLADKLKKDKEKLALLKKTFSELNCSLVLAEEKANTVLEIADQFGVINKERIESESIYERNKKVFFSTIILLAGLIIVFSFTNKKK